MDIPAPHTRNPRMVPVASHPLLTCSFHPSVSPLSKLKQTEQASLLFQYTNVFKLKLKVVHALSKVAEACQIL